MPAILRVRIEVDAAVTADDGCVDDLVHSISAGLSGGPVDPDLLMWLLDGATVWSQVTAEGI
jgi:hypothetical protein